MNCTIFGVGLGVSAGVGALVCGAGIGAAGGVLFGVSGYLAGLGVSWLSSKAFDLEGSYLARIIAVTCVLLARLGAGLLAMSLVGIPMTLALGGEFVLQSFAIQWLLVEGFIWCVSLYRNHGEAQGASRSLV